MPISFRFETQSIFFGLLPHAPQNLIFRLEALGVTSSFPRALQQVGAFVHQLADIRIMFRGYIASDNRKVMPSKSAAGAGIHATHRKGTTGYRRSVATGSVDEPVVEKDRVPGFHFQRMHP